MPQPSTRDPNIEVFGSPYLCEGRLTLSSGNPVTTADVTGAATIYFTPFRGHSLTLYDGVNTWVGHRFEEVALALSGLTLGLPYDVYGYWNDVLVLGLEPWTGPNVRTTLVLQDGIYVMGDDPTRRFLGTIYPTSTNTTEDSNAKRFLSNYYNNRLRRLQYQDTTAHSYNVSVWRPYNNDLATRVECVICMEEDAVPGGVFAQVNSGGYVGVNVDATDGSGVLIKCVGTAANTTIWAGSAPVYFPPTPGYHFFQAVEWSSGGPVSNFTGLVINAMVPG